MVLAVVLVTGIAACSKDKQKSTAPSTTTEAATTTEGPTTTATPPVLAPLLGQPPDNAALIARPALALKVDNSPEGQPHAGLNNADLVFEIKVEGGISRLMEVFHSRDAGQVGPIRSARRSDLDLLAMFGKPLFGWSGAADDVVEVTNATPWIKNVNWNAAQSAYARVKGRAAPHNLMTNTANLFPLAEPGEPAPTAIFSYLAQGETNASAVPMAGFSESFGTTGSEWVWRDDVHQYLRWEYGRPHATDNGQAWANNVVVVQVPYIEGAIPVAQTLGNGSAWVMTQGGVVRGTWTRADRTQPFTLTAADGTPMKLAPGRTWVEVLDGQPAPLLPERVAQLRGS